MGSLLDLESFAAHVEAATRQAGFTVEKRDGLDLYVVLHGEPVRCNLDKAFSAYQTSPHRLDDIVQVHLNALRSVPPPPPPLTEEQAAQSLLPMLNPISWLEEVERKGGLPPAVRPFVAGLVVTYVFDFPHHRAYVNEETLAQIMASPETTFDMVHAHALENLRQRTTSRDYHTHGLDDRTMIVCETHDGYAATRVLLPDLMAEWARRIPGRMLIGIPNRDFLIAFSDRDPAHVAAIARQVRRDAAQREHPLCPDLLVWRDGQAREYRPRQ
jgi:hypothetical protein